MKFAIKYIAAAICVSICTSSFASPLREAVLRNAAIENGFVKPEQTHATVNLELVKVGKLLFESKLLSLNEDTACASCHLDRFGSADGLPNAIGVGGVGHGERRLRSEGAIIPRNTLALWGVGGLEFDRFFWDGKVDKSDQQISSQFGDSKPSDDPLVVAVHLPPAELDEMLRDSKENLIFETESVGSATALYKILTARILSDSRLAQEVAVAYPEVREVTFLHLAKAIAAFIRENFKLQPTKFSKFVFENGALTEAELKGGLVFYGKGRCSGCHKGPYFSDMKFHAIPFPQIGFGKNGYGVDYGRFNTTLNAEEIYKFRTPVLYNVAKTAPYSHSGAVTSLKDAIIYHFDPLKDYQSERDDSRSRAEFYKRLSVWSNETFKPELLNEDDIENLITFLGTLEFEAQMSVLELE
ncbi:cytochrome c peroxidase [Pseudovibrio denitrificans]|uniref:Cytochrome c peroxidase n=1 Tax=Pseudovibrio denitrificans TaxID=258256 RepID=A0A1I7DZA2_9HYPH|nr:His-Xaa-Ser system-associated MauG-like protein [Pseudovibrio denitrificans]SFU16999.1 cytochrome c peroxidase [Pseudovibrio denitrificans]